MDILNKLLNPRYFTGIITYINLTSVKLYVKLNNIFGFAKVFACFVVIFGGIYHLISKDTSNLQTGFEGTDLKLRNIALSLYSGLWYDLTGLNVFS